MPDTYTRNPEKLRGLLEHGGFRCGVEARVLKPRDKEWTCHIDGKDFIADVYIHDAFGFVEYQVALSFLFVGMSLGLMAGLLLGRGKLRLFYTASLALVAVGVTLLSLLRGVPTLLLSFSILTLLGILIYFTLRRV